MKRLALGVAVFLGWTATALAIQTVDGFCTKKVLAMEGARHVDATSSSIRGEAKAFYEKSVRTAIEHYKKYPIFEGDRAVEVYSADVLFGNDPEWRGKRMLGVKTTLHMNGDEDHITYYFYKESWTDVPKLKMYLHDEQSALAFWTCE